MSATGEDELSLRSPIWSFKGCRDVDLYERLDQIGAGTYGQVYKARNSQTGEIVALKKIRLDTEGTEGFPITAIREIKIMRTLEHPNVLKLKEVATTRDKNHIFLVFEYFEHDLSGLADLTLGRVLSLPQVKYIMKQILQGLSYCHQKGYIHRDVKASNILINQKGCVRIADFGLSREVRPDNQARYTNNVVTRWYRAPELLLGDVKYTVAIDIWSVGCLLAELLNSGKPILQGNDEIDQLDKIFRLCGTPTIQTWPSVKELPFFKKLMPQRQYRKSLKEQLKHFAEDSLDLVDKMLALDPSKRCSGAAALGHPFFTANLPGPCAPTALPVRTPPCNEWNSKKRRSQVAYAGANKVARVDANGRNGHQKSYGHSSYGHPHHQNGHHHSSSRGHYDGHGHGHGHHTNGYHHGGNRGQNGHYRQGHHPGASGAPTAAGAAAAAGGTAGGVPQNGHYRGGHQSSNIRPRYSVPRPAHSSAQAWPRQSHT